MDSTDSLESILVFAWNQTRSKNSYHAAARICDGLYEGAKKRQGEKQTDDGSQGRTEKLKRGGRD